MAISTGSVPLATDAQRAAFTDSIEQAACAGMSGTCSVSLLSYRRRQLGGQQLGGQQLGGQQQLGLRKPNLREIGATAGQVVAAAPNAAGTDTRAAGGHSRHMQSGGATISLSREYDYSASTASDQSAASLVGDALSSQGASVTSVATTSLSASTAVIVVGEESDPTAITSAMRSDSLAAALSTRLPGVEVEIEAPTLSAPPPPPPPPQPLPPADLPPMPPALPPPLLTSVVDDPASAIGAAKPEESSSTMLIVIIAAAAGVAVCVIAAVTIALRRRRSSRPRPRRDKRFESQQRDLHEPASGSSGFFAAGLESQAPDPIVSVQMHAMEDMEMQPLPGYKQSSEALPRPRQSLPRELMPTTMELVTVGHI